MTSNNPTQIHANAIAARRGPSEISIAISRQQSPAPVPPVKAEPPPKSFFEKGQALFEVAAGLYRMEALPMPAKFPSRFLEGVSAELRQELTVLIAATADSAAAAEKYGIDQITVELSRQRAELIKNPAGPLVQDREKIRVDFEQRRRAYRDQLSVNFGRRMLDVQKTVLGIVLSAIEQEAEKMIDFDAGKARDFGLEMVPDVATMALVRLHQQIHQQLESLHQTERDWVATGGIGQSMCVSGTLRSLLGGL